VSKAITIEQAEKQTIKEIVDNNWFFLKIMLKHSPFYIIATCIYAFIHAVIVFTEHTIGIKLIFDAIQNKEPFSKVLIFIIIITVLLLFMLLSGRLYYHIIQVRGREKLLKTFRSSLYEKATKTDLACYDNPDYYNDFVLSINEVRTRVNNMIDYLYVLCTFLTQVFLISGFFFIYDKIGLIFVALSLFTSIFVNLYINRLKLKMELELNPKERKRKYINRVFYLADYAKELRLNNVSHKLNEEFSHANQDIRETVRGYSKKLLPLSIINYFVCRTFIIDGLYMLYIAFMTLVRGVFSYGTALALVNSAWNLNNTITNMTKLASDFQENSLYISRIRKFLDYENRIVDTDKPIPLVKIPTKIELKNISFAYSLAAEPIIKNLSLTIEANEKVAFVGYNGAGKTTLMKLLMRLYDPTEGEILVNGRNIKEYSLEEYRQAFGTVFQDYQLFATTIANNVVMEQQEDIDSTKIINALEHSGFSSRLAELEQGIHTPLTREFDNNGTNLSGGEAQKVAIARVFAKECPFIILDEPSSALDPISEYHMNQYMFKAAEHKTVIFISHRLSTTRMADKIFLLENGQITEEGTHQQLMARKGTYAEMFNLQAEKYRQVSGLA